MVVDYQTQPIGGDVWLRLIAFLPNGRTFHARTYGPPYDEYKTDTEHQFKFTLE